MQNGPYIADRLLPGLVKAYAEQYGIDFQAFSGEWVLRLERDGIIKWIVGYTFDVNSAAAAAVARDKVATYATLQAAGIDTMPHYLVRSLPHELIHVRELHEVLNGLPVVAKPLEGAGGRDVILFKSTDDALAMIRQSGEPAWALSPFRDLSAEYRLIILDGELLFSYEKSQPALREGLKLFNLGLGAKASPIEGATLAQLLPMAQQVTQATALRLAAVDIVRLADGSLQVMEVNGGVMMEHFLRQSPENKNRAVAVYEAILNAMFA
jgi:glutathione synthase/RimK-type ligase-like ATP-grasp enzyme